MHLPGAIRTSFQPSLRRAALSRLALLILAVIIAIPVAPLRPETAELLARLLAVAVIGLIGWAAIIALHIAADLYLRRFRLDVDDNLLARKHNTQVRVLSRTIDVLLVMLTLGAALMTFPPCGNTASACSPPPASPASSRALPHGRC